MRMRDDVRAEATAMVAISDADAPDLAGAFTAGERAYAESKSDPGRRLAARLAAKQAALQALGGGLELADVEVVRGRGGPPRIELTERARARLHAVGGERMLVSLTHGRTHAAAVVLVLGPPPR
jgi:holo-[acyl-carrier protein] synthase